MRRRLRDSLRNPFVVIPAVVVVFLAAFGGWWFGIRSDGESAGAATSARRLVAVTKGSMDQTVSAEGTVAAAQTDDLSFTSAGTVTAVGVKAGDTVTAGQVLATIDSAKLTADVASAEATVADAEAALADDRSSGASDAQITADEATLTTANDSLSAAQEQLSGASLVATFDGTVASVDLTVGEQLTSGGTGGTDATGSDSGTGQSSSTLGSGGNGGPNADASSSSDSSSSTAQIQVVSTGRYTVELSVDSADVGSVAVGQSATVALSTSSTSSNRFGGAFPGGFRSFAGAGRTDSSNGSSAQRSSGNGSTGGGSTGDRSTASGTATPADGTGTVTAVGQVADASSGVATYPVTISFTSDNGNLTVGSTVTGDITIARRDGVLQVPTLAVTTTGGTSTVVVATDGTATGPTETRTVTTGLRSDGMVEITDGLSAGEQVVITLGGFGPAGGTFSPPSGAAPGAGQAPGAEVGGPAGAGG